MERDSQVGRSPEAARAIARAAYVYLYPLVANYGAAYEMAIHPPSGRSALGRWRRWQTVGRMLGHAREASRQVSYTWLDLGPEPMLVQAPRWEPVMSLRRPLSSRTWAITFTDAAMTEGLRV